MQRAHLHARLHSLGHSLGQGTASSVKRQQAEVAAVAAQHGGMSAGERNGARGYFLTFMIAYIRDFGLGYHCLSESFETSVPWGDLLILCHEVMID